MYSVWAHENNGMAMTSRAYRRLVDYALLVLLYLSVAWSVAAVVVSIIKLARTL